MPIKHEEIQIDPKNPFQNCQLQRKKYAEVLTSIIEDNSNGFVLALNNKWGTGKTTFIKMWQQTLIINGYKTLYFNAWENDFDNNSLVALIGEFQTLSTTKTKKLFTSIIKNGAVLSKNILPGIAKAIANKYIDVEAISSTIEETTKGITEILSKEVDEYLEKKKALKNFKDEMVKYIKEVNNGKPLVFIIDELDRCRPSFSVELLEQIKHFFSVEGIVFVLSIDKEQLGYAINGFYGSDKLDVEEYLRRFIDLEFSIPEPNIEIAIPYFINYYNFKEFLSEPSRVQYSDLSRDLKLFNNVSVSLFQAKPATLRQIEKLFAHAKIALKSFQLNNYVLPETFLYLIYLRFFFKEIYNKISSYSYSAQEFLDALSSTYPEGINSDNVGVFQYIEAIITCLYLRSHPEHNYKQIMHELISSNEYKVNFKSQLDKFKNSKDFTQLLRDVYSTQRFIDVPLNFLLDKIDLKEKILK